MALGRENFERIFFIRSALHDGAVRDLGIEYSDSVMMSQGNSDVLHPSGSGDRDASVAIQLSRIEEHGQAIVFVYFELAIVEDPFPDAEYAVNTPMDEHAKFYVLKFAAGLKISGRRLVRGLCE